MNSLVSREGSLTRYVSSLAVLPAFAFLYAIQQEDAAAFHTIVEFSITAGAIVIGLVGIQTSRLSSSSLILYLSCGFLLVGVISAAHTLACLNPDVQVGSASGHDLALLRGLAEGGVFLSGALLAQRMSRADIFVSTSVLAFALAAWWYFSGWPAGLPWPESLRAWHIEPEYAVMLLLALAAVCLHYCPYLSGYSSRLLIAAIAVNLGYESVHLLVDHEDVGFFTHVLKLVGYWFVFSAILQRNLLEPLAVLDRRSRAYDAIPDPVIVVNENGSILQANAAAIQLATDKHGHFTDGQHYHTLFHSQEMPLETCPVCTLISQGVSVCDLEWEHPGWGRWYSVALSPLHLRGRSIGTVVVMSDITYGKRAEASLRKKQALLEEAETLARLGSWEWDTGNDRIQMSDQLCMLYGLASGARVVPRGEFLALVHPEDREVVRSTMDDFIAGRSAATIRYRTANPQALRYMESVLRREVGNGAQASRVIGTAQDVTDYTNAVEQSHRIAEQLEAVFCVINSHIAYLDADFNFLRVNPTYAAGAGKPVEFFPGKNHFDLFPNPGNEAIFRKVVDTGIPYVVEAKRFENPLRPDSTTTYWDWSLQPIKNGQGEVVALVLNLLDVTERHMVEEQRARHAEELSAAKLAAERASAAKTRFLATASHDLRQPIQAVHILLHILQAQGLEPEARQLVCRIEGAMDGLRGMLDTLLDMSKLEAGLVVPEFSLFPVQSVLRRLADDFEPVAANKGIQLITEECQEVVFSDSKCLARILSNLLSNAIRYTSKGKVVVRCRSERDELRIEVIDSGPGIPEDQVENIFVPFHQIGNLARDRREGIGLGLAIVDRLLNLLGHSIQVSSTLGKGSTFSVSVPCGVTNALLPVTSPRTTRFADGIGAIVLVIDDDIDIREGMVMLLEGWGYAAFSAESASAALDCVLANDLIPDAVIADFRLGETTGIDAIRLLKDKLDVELPGILLTGDTEPACLLQANASGFLLLHKPIRPEELRSELGTIIARSRQRPADKQYTRGSPANRPRPEPDPDPDPGGACTAS